MTSGPWDVHDLPEDDSVERIDFLGIKVPTAQDMEVRVDFMEGQVTSVTLVFGQDAIQLGAYAAPKSSGIWDEVRAEIAQSIRQQGGSAEEADGTFGRELRAQVPVEVPGQQRSLQPARFIAVDGPRWFLRGLITGPAVTDQARARRLEEAFRGVVVVRGTDAMAPRDQIPLRVPRDMLKAAASQLPPELVASQEAQHQLEDFNPFERGPEITEIR